MVSHSVVVRHRIRNEANSRGLWNIFPLDGIECGDKQGCYLLQCNQHWTTKDSYKEKRGEQL